MTIAPKRRRRAQGPAGEDRRIVEVLPPEGVPIRFRVAGLGGRFAAQLADLVLTGLMVTSALIVLGLTDWLSSDAMLALAALMFFFLRVPYYVITEMLWNGQTLGKRLLRLRVISADGRTLSPHAVTVRNLMKEMEVFVPGTYLLVATTLDRVALITLLAWLALLLAVPLFSRHRQRLGDIIANTYVVNIPRPVLLPDLARTEQVHTSGRFVFQPHHLDHYGRFELQTLEQVLQVREDGLNAAAKAHHTTNLARIAEAIIRRIGFEDTVAPHDFRAFLGAFYTTQRAYLESRRLFGDRREDKFHRDTPEKK